MTRTSRARILPLTRTNEAGEKLRETKGRLKTPSSVGALLNSAASINRYLPNQITIHN
jgi:hypothetical protein